MTLERTGDYELLNGLLRGHGNLYPFIADDFALPLAECAVIEHPLVWYILARDEDDLLGFWMFAPDNGNAICWVFHTVMPLERRALGAMKELLGADGWLWSNTPCLRAVTSVPAWNAIARRFGLRAGLKEYGRNPMSYKSGKLHDQILMGISKPEAQ